MTIHKKGTAGAVAAALLLICAGTEAAAQRTSYKSTIIGISQKVTANSLPSGGLEIYGGQYLMDSYWTVGASVTDWNQKISTASGPDTQECFDHIMWNVNGGWMYRLAGTYNRVFSLYIGGKAFLGCNHYEVFRDLPQELEADIPEREFIYGIEPGLDMEIYVTRWLAFSIGIQSPLTFGSSLRSDLWHLTGSIGIKLNL